MRSMVFMVLSALVLTAVVQADKGRGRKQQGAKGHRPFGLCLVKNATTDEVLCDASSSCPKFTLCAQHPKGRNRPLDKFVQLQFCIPKACSDSTPCDEGATCQASFGRSEKICVPNVRPTDQQAEGDAKRCRKVLGDIIKNVRKEQPRQPRFVSKPCKLTNLTTSIVLCIKSCPDFTECSLPGRRPRTRVDKSLEVQICIPKKCDTDACPAGSTCNSASRCVPDSSDNTESCIDELRAIISRTRPSRRPNRRLNRRPNKRPRRGQ